MGQASGQAPWNGNECLFRKRLNPSAELVSASRSWFFDLIQERKTNPRSGTKDKLSSTNEEPPLMLFQRAGHSLGWTKTVFQQRSAIHSNRLADFYYEVGTGLYEARTGRT